MSCHVELHTDNGFTQAPAISIFTHTDDEDGVGRFLNTRRNEVTSHMALSYVTLIISDLAFFK